MECTQLKTRLGSLLLWLWSAVRAVQLQSSSSDVEAPAMAIKQNTNISFRSAVYITLMHWQDNRAHAWLLWESSVIPFDTVLLFYNTSAVLQFKCYTLIEFSGKCNLYPISYGHAPAPSKLPDNWRDILLVVCCLVPLRNKCNLEFILQNKIKFHPLNLAEYLSELSQHIKNQSVQSVWRLVVFDSVPARDLYVLQSRGDLGFWLWIHNGMESFDFNTHIR